MIKLVLAGLIGIVAALGGAFFGYDLLMGKGTDEGHEEVSEQLEQFSSELTGIPIINGNSVLGYVVLRVSSTVDVAKLPSKEFDIQPYLVDAAFKATYGFSQRGFERIRPADVDRLAREIASLANLRFGSDAVKSVNLEQFNFVKKSETRGMLLNPK